MGAGDIIELLLNAKKLNDEASLDEEGGREKIPQKVQDHMGECYRETILKELEINPEPPAVPESSPVPCLKPLPV